MSAQTLPAPTGFRLLVEMPGLRDKSEGGIYIPESTKKLEETASIVGKVIAMGPTAYKDEGRFPTGPWCQVGDYVVLKSYSGTRFKVRGQEYRFVNDDTVEGVVDDPHVVERV